MKPGTSLDRPLLPRLLSGGLALVTLYYLRFFATRQEPLTLLQAATFACAAGFLLLRERPPQPRSIWFHGWRPIQWQGWTAVVAVVLLAAAVFFVMDRDAHSVSDTPHRIVPTYGLIVAYLLKLRYERAEVAADG